MKNPLSTVCSMALIPTMFLAAHMIMPLTAQPEPVLVSPHSLCPTTQCTISPCAGFTNWYQAVGVMPYCLGHPHTQCVIAQACYASCYAQYLDLSTGESIAECHIMYSVQPPPTTTTTTTPPLPVSSTTAKPTTANPNPVQSTNANANTATPTTPMPSTAAPITAAPVTSAPVTPAPITPAPVRVTPAPVTPAPTTATPITAAPVTPIPTTPAPVIVTPAPTPITPAPVLITPAPTTPVPITPAPTTPITPAPTTPLITPAPTTPAATTGAPIPVTPAPVISTTVPVVVNPVQIWFDPMSNANLWQVSSVSHVTQITDTSHTHCASTDCLRISGYRDQDCYMTRSTANDYASYRLTLDVTLDNMESVNYCEIYVKFGDTAIWQKLGSYQGIFDVLQKFPETTFDFDNADITATRLYVKLETNGESRNGRDYCYYDNLYLFGIPAVNSQSTNVAAAAAVAVKQEFARIDDESVNHGLDKAQSSKFAEYFSMESTTSILIWIGLLSVWCIVCLMCCWCTKQKKSRPTADGLDIDIVDADGVDESEEDEVAVGDHEEDSQDIHDMLPDTPPLPEEV